MENETLPSTRDNETTRRKVVKATRAKFPGYRYDVFFEHGHWWARVIGYHGEDGDATFDVVDSEPSVAGTGFDFEEVG